MNVKGKRVLMMGLGLLGGGVATVNWLLDRGARVTVTDLKDEKSLAASVRKVHEHIKKSSRDGDAYSDALGRLTWMLGGHTDEMVRACDVVMLNQDVPVSSPYVRLAAKLGKTVANEADVFYLLWKGPTVGITGTRGKTTTAHWCAHLLGGHRKAVAVGNSQASPFLEALKPGTDATTAVTELPSFLLEHFSAAPDIAVITNLYRDHLNRHGTMEEYAKAKASIFYVQSSKNQLVLNRDDDWTDWFLAQKPKAKVWFVSSRPLESGSGLFQDGGWLWFLDGGMAKRVLEVGDFAARHGTHNLANFRAAALVARLAGCPWDVIARRAGSLPDIPYRQETVHRGGKVTVINDTCATSPEGAVAALERFGGPNCILIAGGTDRDLEYSGWAKTLVRSVKPENTIFLEGTATAKMRKALKRSALGRRTYDTLERCLDAALARAGTYVHAVVLFSPGAKSFGPFKNEYDRGQQFNALVRGRLGRSS